MCGGNAGAVYYRPHAIQRRVTGAPSFVWLVCEQATTTCNDIDRHGLTVMPSTIPLEHKVQSTVQYSTVQYCRFRFRSIGLVGKKPGRAKLAAQLSTFA
jgi:hypothetical protein